MRPNILLFHCHDLGRYLGCYGATTVNSPSIDRFAAEGVLFSNSFCVAPQCSPSRAAMFTGRYPHNNGVMGLSHSVFGWDLHDTELHLAAQLNETGYHTISVGVMHETQKPAEQWGYEERCDLRENAAGALPVCDATIKLLERFASSATESTAPPFFISSGCYEPHRIPAAHEKHHMGFVGDYIQPDSEKGIGVPAWLSDDEDTLRELAELQGAIRYVDYHFGRVLDALDRAGLRDNTLVVFTTDHGIAMPRAKCSCYDPGLEIALIARLPARQGWHGGRRVDALVPNIDLMPSLCEAAGASVPPVVQGRSWVPLLDGQTDATHDQYIPNDRFFPEMTYHDYYDPIRAVRTERHKLLVYFTAAPSFMPPNQSWKPRSSPLTPAEPSISYHPVFELYDLTDDPGERSNLFDDPACAEVQTDLLRSLMDHLKATEDPVLTGAVTPPGHRHALTRLMET